MRFKNRITAAFGVLFIGLGLFAGKASGSEPIPIRPFGVRFETASDASLGGANVLRVFVSSTRGCDTVQLEILKIHNLEYNGPHKITRFMDSDTIVFYLPIEIPPNDTSGFDFWISGCGGRMLDKAFWVLGGDSVEFYRGNPRLWAPQPRRGPPKGRKTLDPPPHTGPTVRMGYTDEDGNFIEGHRPKKEPPISKYIGKIEPGDTTMMAWKRNDSGWLELVKVPDLPTKRDLDIEKMREKEKTPLTEFDVQHIMVGDEIWGRNKGEYKFTKVVTTTNPGGEARRQSDSIRAANMDREYDYILDLRDTADYNFIRSIAGKTEPTDSSGYYRVTIKKVDVVKIEARKIRHALYPRYPGQPPRTRRRNKSSKGDSDSTTRPSGDISPQSRRSGAGCSRQILFARQQAADEGVCRPLSFREESTISLTGCRLRKVYKEMVY